MVNRGGMPRAPDIVRHKELGVLGDARRSGGQSPPIGFRHHHINPHQDGSCPNSHRSGPHTLPSAETMLIWAAAATAVSRGGSDALPKPLVPRHQPLEAGVAAERRPGRIGFDPRGRSVGRYGDHALKLVNGGVRLPHGHVDLG